MKFNPFYALSFWLYIIAILFSLDIIPYSPLLLWIFSFPFFLQMVIIKLNKAHFMKKVFFIIWEFLFLLMVSIKTTSLDVGFNFTIFTAYLIFISINQKSVCEIYNERIPKLLNNNENIFKTLIKFF